MQSLVHALAALALMGVADLWLIMNLSAQFAHAKRDLRDLKKRLAALSVHTGSLACGLPEPECTVYTRKLGPARHEGKVDDCAWTCW